MEDKDALVQHMFMGSWVSTHKLQHEIDGEKEKNVDDGAQGGQRKEEEEEKNEAKIEKVADEKTVVGGEGDEEVAERPSAEAKTKRRQIDRQSPRLQL